MTIACVWLNNSFGKSRITAIADSRASITANKATTIETDDTVKLVPIGLHCHKLDALDLHFERFIGPYFQTELGIAYSGDCFSAFNIIALFSRAMGQLATEIDDALPGADGIAEALRSVVDAFFAKAQGYTKGRDVDFLLFGYEPTSEQPWVAELSRRAADATKINVVNPIGSADFFCIGDGTNAHDFLDNTKDVRRRIKVHAEGLRLKPEEDAIFQLELEAARLEVANKKAVEENALGVIESTFIETVGGELQKLEVHPYGRSAFASHTAGLGYHILRNVPPLPPGIHFPTVTELAGRKKR